MKSISCPVNLSPPGSPSVIDSFQEPLEVALPLLSTDITMINVTRFIATEPVYYKVDNDDRSAMLIDFVSDKLRPGFNHITGPLVSELLLVLPLDGMCSLRMSLVLAACNGLEVTTFPKMIANAREEPIMPSCALDYWSDYAHLTNSEFVKKEWTVAELADRLPMNEFQLGNDDVNRIILVQIGSTLHYAI
jgi:hypothetical protein